MNRRMNQRGFTLIELLVAVAVTGLLIGIIMTYMVNALATNTIDVERESLLQQAQTALDTANNDILLSANAATTNAWADSNGPGGAANPYSWTSNSTTLVLNTAVQDTSGHIIFDDPLHYVSAKNNRIYFVQNGTLYRRTLADPVSGNALSTSCPASLASSTCPADSVVTGDVSKFLVTYYDDNGDQTNDPTAARGVGLELKLHEYKYNHNIDVDYTTRTVFRND